jgi:hypothetical protein
MKKIIGMLFSLILLLALSTDAAYAEELRAFGQINGGEAQLLISENDIIQGIEEELNDGTIINSAYLYEVEPGAWRLVGEGINGSSSISISYYMDEVDDYIYPSFYERSDKCEGDPCSHCEPYSPQHGCPCKDGQEGHICNHSVLTSSPFSDGMLGSTVSIYL